jgi:ABC-type transport system substrate-binding protein
VDNVSEDQVFRYNEDVSVNTLDPIYIKSQSEIWIGSQIYEGLVALDSSLKPVPKIAKHWFISDSGRVYKFVLKPHIYFSIPQGKKSDFQIAKRKVNSYDVGHSLYRLLDPKNTSPGSWILNDKMDFPDLPSASPQDYSAVYQDSNSPIYCPNDSVVIVRIKQAFPAFLSLLATNYAWIVPKEKSGLGMKPAGTGPFVVRRWETDVKLVLLKNPNYHEFEDDVQLPYLKAVNVSFIKSKQTAFMQFMAGQYDFFNGVESSFRDKILTSDGKISPEYKNKINGIITDFLNTEYIGFYLGDSLNNQLNPFTDFHLRKALQWSVDRASMLRFFRNGLGRVGGAGFVPPSLMDDKTVPISFNLDSAKKHLALSQWKQNPSAYAPLELTTTTDYLDMAVFLQGAWKKLGIDVSLSIQTGGMLRQLRQAGKLGMFRGSWIADYPDSENYLSCFYSPYEAPNGPNYTHYESRKYDSLFQKVAYGVVMNEHQNRQRQYQARLANDLLRDEAPILVLYYDKSLRLSQKNVIGLGNDPINRLDLRRVRKLKN